MSLSPLDCCAPLTEVSANSTPAGSSSLDSVSQWEIVVEGDSLYGSMEADIAQARFGVRMESYIFAADVVGRRIAAALIAQSRRGRRVVLRVDYAGSRWQLSDALVRDIRDSGVQFSWSRRWQWWRPWAFHRRNHRKLLIVDNAIAYVGGFNVHSASSRDAIGPSRWRDTHVRFCGPLVQQAIRIFDGVARKASIASRTGGSFSLIQSSSRQCRRQLRCEMDRALRAASQRIWLTTPYFVPDSGLRRRLTRAARRGVDVCLLVPGKNDVPIVQWAARALYSRLLKQGVRIFEYQGRVLHAKTLVVDGSWASVGSANFDYRSLFLNLEINLIGSDAAFGKALADQFIADLECAREVTQAHWRGRSWWYVAGEWLAWRLRRWL